MLADISRKMQRKAEKGDHDPLKILVHSTHDTAIAALCSTLDVFDERCSLQALYKVELYSSSPVQMACLHSVNHLRVVQEDR